MAKKSFFHSGYGSSPQSRASNINAIDARVMAFSRTFFLERFWREFWISFKFHKPISKTVTYRPKNDIFCLLISLVFLFDIFSSNALIDMVEILFSRENCPKMCLKINWSLKTPWHRHSMGVARSLWAPVDGYNNIKSAFLEFNALKELFWRLTISPIETIIKPTNSNQNLR